MLDKKKKIINILVSVHLYGESNCWLTSFQVCFCPLLTSYELKMQFYFLELKNEYHHLTYPFLFDQKQKVGPIIPLKVRYINI